MNKTELLIYIIILVFVVSLIIKYWKTGREE